MKKIAVVLLVVVVLLPAMAKAQTGFIVGLMMGSLLGSDGKHTGAEATVLYTAHRVFERVKNPLAMKQTSIGFYPADRKNHNGVTLWKLFLEAVGEESAATCEILQVVRIFNGGKPKEAAIWFVFIDKDQLLPLSALPPVPPAK